MSKREQGEATRRSVLGDAHVNRSQGKATEFDRGFVDMITEGAWGTVWSSDAITKRERSMITLALLAGLGNFEEFQLHLRATVNTGATREDIREVLHHVAVYAGVPRANHAFKLAKEIYAELEEDGQ
ncbi:4-carboxymuconolactone decarboxylase [Oceanicola sp. 22II-s10i]|uniref:4-carboxymuconolactone decarboxylase n=1 Tax=Oceanicola sp. 22II-s10i TaxID=1317116 RepID=UPI000B523D4E|nr:4-carboxymuconolactone decarboxylase [Oceanicola sp. 22II-s10i]OWU85503.1 4-carboxymuconolactone decarboxylase [Oceanicola sp. 22II-s10i]